MKVLKFGGTSVGSAERIRSIVKIIDSDEVQIVVLSAMAGVTNQLTEIAGYFYQDSKQKINKAIGQLRARFIEEAEALLTSGKNREDFEKLVALHFNQIISHSEYLMNEKKEKEILSKGEILTSTLVYLYLTECGFDAVLLNALDFIRVDKDREPDNYYIREKLKGLLTENNGKRLFITQGYICRNVYGEADNLGRGGSDYSATIMGSVLDADEVQIWTDITGVHNNDPRFVNNTHPIAALSYHEAAELAYFGAKIIHPLTLIPCMDKNIPVLLKNSFLPKEKGTVISNKLTGTGIKAVAAKDGIAVIKVKSGRMLLAYGFLRRIFEIFEGFKTPVDVITTSEVAVSMTIDNLDQLEGIRMALSKLGQVEIDLDQSIICIVGNFKAEEKGYAKIVFTALEEVPVRMISYGGSYYNITVVVNSTDKVKALEALSDKIEFIQ